MRTYQQWLDPFCVLGADQGSLRSHLKSRSHLDQTVYGAGWRAFQTENTCKD